MMVSAALPMAITCGRPPPSPKVRHEDEADVM